MFAPLVLVSISLAAPTGSLSQLATKYQCGYADDARKIQCVMGMLRAHCLQERSNLRAVALAPKTDPAVKAFDDCVGDGGADPFDSELASWAAAEVYLHRGLDLLADRDRAAGTSWVRVVPPSRSSVLAGEGVTAIRDACSETRRRRDELLAALPDSTAPEAARAQAKALLASDKGFARCDTIVANGWGSAVGYAVFLQAGVDLAERVLSP